MAPKGTHLDLWRPFRDQMKMLLIYDGSVEPYFVREAIVTFYEEILSRWRLFYFN